MAELNSSIPTPPGKQKGSPLNMIVVAIILGVALIFLVYMYFDKKNKMAKWNSPYSGKRFPGQ